MKLLALGKDVPGVSQNDFEPYLREEALRVWDLTQSGIIRESYFCTDRSDAVLVLECNDANHAKDILSTLPLVREGLIAFDVIPLKPYPGFSRLFHKP